MKKPIESSTLVKQHSNGTTITLRMPANSVNMKIDTGFSSRTHQAFCQQQGTHVILVAGNVATFIPFSTLNEIHIACHHNSFVYYCNKSQKQMDSYLNATC